MDQKPVLLKSGSLESQFVDRRSMKVPKFSLLIPTRHAGNALIFFLLIDFQNIYIICFARITYVVR